MGHPEEEVDRLINAGIYSMDKFAIFETLNRIKEKKERAIEQTTKEKAAARTKVERYDALVEKRDKSKATQYYSPFDEFTPEEIERLGFGAKSLEFNAEKHLGI